MLAFIYSFIWTRSWENVSYAICEQQMHRSVCASGPSDQRLCCLLLRWYNSYTCYIQSFKTLASFCSWPGWAESYLLANPWRYVFPWCCSYVITTLPHDIRQGLRSLIAALAGVVVFVFVIIWHFFFWIDFYSHSWLVSSILNQGNQASSVTVVWVVKCFISDL